MSNRYFYKVVIPFHTDDCFSTANPLFVLVLFYFLILPSPTNGPLALASITQFTPNWEGIGTAFCDETKSEKLYKRHCVPYLTQGINGQKSNDESIVRADDQQAIFQFTHKEISTEILEFGKQQIGKHPPKYILKKRKNPIAINTKRLQWQSKTNTIYNAIYSLQSVMLGRIF
ncbi:MAG: hypothetical protein AAFZ15_20295 [Bacteroidota bacterium]